MASFHVKSTLFITLLLILLSAALLSSALPQPTDSDFVQLDADESAPHERRLAKRAVPPGTVPALPKYKYERGPHLSFLYLW